MVVIAFFTDEILCNGGPEFFHGLPGMILGVAIPRMHTTWYATKLELMEVNWNQQQLPSRGRKVSRGEYRKQIDQIYQNRGIPDHRWLWQMYF